MAESAEQILELSREAGIFREAVKVARAMTIRGAEAVDGRAPPIEPSEAARSHSSRLEERTGNASTNSAASRR